MINKKAFTLIEILVAIAIIGIMVTIATFGIQGAREAARDAKRKTDLQNIKTALELFYSDCGYYPSQTANEVPSPLVGDNGNTRCLPDSVYMSQVPLDPQPTGKSYFYDRPTSTSYILCVALEDPPEPAEDVTGCSGVSDCGEACNYKITGP